MTGVKRLVVICAVFLGNAALEARVSAATALDCGDIGEECCDDGEPCVEGAVCQGGECVACGGVDQPCCEEGECNEGALCLGDDCVACGGQGQICCVESCNTGLICFGEVADVPTGSGASSQLAEARGGAAGLGLSMCVPCGGVNQPCCDGGQCNEGLLCQGFDERSVATGGGAGSFFPTCVSCGALGEPCCPDGNGGTCDSPFLLCGGSNLCEACGDVGQQCCSTPNPCPLSGGECAGSICEAGPLSAPALRGAGIAALTLALLSVAIVTVRRWSGPV